MTLSKWNSYELEPYPPPHEMCPCCACDGWHQKRVNVGDLCVPRMCYNSRHDTHFKIKSCMTATWDPKGPLLWGYRPPEGTMLLCIAENPVEKQDAHLAPITILVPMPDGSCEPRVTSKRWLVCISRGLMT